jgi:hypothetical protein
MFFSQWSYASKKANVINQTSINSESKPKTHVRESLSNILVTHFDFRRPILDHEILNSTKDNETIERIPESCIEEFNLYVSTWKGWQGPLPSKDNKITWEQIEHHNTRQGTVTCTRSIKASTENLQTFYDNETNSSTTLPPIIIAESFSYSISKIPKTNLMLLYVNHSKEASLLCPKFIIKRKPVEFTPDEWCTRLKTTPYRERPHKCFFVHDGEKKPLFTKCSNANRLTYRYLSIIFVITIIQVFPL